jgi:SAM-dependent methyltransferase
MLALDIKPAGSDTGSWLTCEKRIRLVNLHAALKGKRVLDAGCGAGSYVLRMAQEGADVTGIEFEPGKVADYEKASGLRNVLVGDIEHMPFSNADFDLVFSNEVLEHVPNDAAALREIHRVLRPDGVLCVFVPNRLYPLETHGCYTQGGTRLSAFTPFVPWLPDVLARRWLRFENRNYWRRDIEQLLTQAGFGVVHYQTVWQTLSNSSGKIPRRAMFLVPLGRYVLSVLEKLPLVGRFGISHFVVCRKTGQPAA